VKRCAPAADRNKEAILEVLREVLPERGLVLELASGSGQHAAFFAEQLPNHVWQPSDADPPALESVGAYVAEAGLPNLRPPLLLDARSETWPLEAADAVVCINMIHIAPLAACAGLLRGASRLLPDTGPLILYGPFSIHGDFTAPSNVQFDRALRAQNEEWGVRELADIERSAAEIGLTLDSVVARPANNHVVVLRQRRR
jgi:SAM-dependent methyltransferase